MAASRGHVQGTCAPRGIGRLGAGDCRRRPLWRVVLRTRGLEVFGPRLGDLAGLWRGGAFADLCNLSLWPPQMPAVWISARNLRVSS